MIRQRELNMEYLGEVKTDHNYYLQLLFALRAKYSLGAKRMPEMWSPNPYLWRRMPHLLNGKVSFSASRWLV
jgi:hypothetical protein